MDAQTQLQRAREMIQAQGKPVTTANLNAAMLAIVQDTPADQAGSMMTDAVDASLEGRRAAPRMNGGTRMTPAHRDPAEAPVRIDANQRAQDAVDRLQEANPIQQAGQHLRQPGMQDIERDLEANVQSTATNPSSMNARVVGVPNAQTEQPQVTMRRAEIDHSASPRGEAMSRFDAMLEDPRVNSFAAGGGPSQLVARALGVTMRGGQAGQAALAGPRPMLPSPQGALPAPAPALVAPTGVPSIPPVPIGATNLMAAPPPAPGVNPLMDRIMRGPNAVPPIPPNMQRWLDPAQPMNWQSPATLRMPMQAFR